jgi:hypothetical protein
MRALLSALPQAWTRTRATGRQLIAARENVMSLNLRQQCQLRRIESRLLRSEPHLAAMLTVFGRLSADERMPASEQVITRLDRMWRAAILIVTAVIAMAVTIGLLVSSVLASLIRAIRIWAIRIWAIRARPAQPARQQTGPGSRPGALQRLRRALSPLTLPFHQYS